MPTNPSGKGPSHIQEAGGPIERIAGTERTSPYSGTVDSEAPLNLLSGLSSAPGSIALHSHVRDE